MVFKSLDRTLEDAEVKEAVQSIIDEAAKVGAGLWGHN
jgi:phenylalanyl-tRNA synthetase beta subunit